MNFYDFFMAPLEKYALGKIRKELISQAQGRVLEIGIGSGANYPHYDFNKITNIIGTDIKSFSTLNNKKLNKIEYIECSAQNLPFDNNSFDTVITTLVMCSVSDVEIALAEIKRVIKPTGKYLFIEHIRPHNYLGSILNIFNVLWKRNPFGCQINKKTDILIDKAGFRVVSAKRKALGILYYGFAEV